MTPHLTVSAVGHSPELYQLALFSRVLLLNLLFFSCKKHS